ncbi:hypothetical protein KDN24_06360 [Bacillus sp. Bva_UNVM-123]|uniref:hypothetical protein n=1 Tax=Bacillus sp. Bva_UNVM-123 TaxID=2829798 RepID=UPI00391FAEDC
MKMTIDEFIKRQDEFEGYKIKFKAKRKDGSVNYFERIVNDKFCKPSGDFFEILEVEILEHIGITTLKINENGLIGLKR